MSGLHPRSGPVRHAFLPALLWAVLSAPLPAAEITPIPLDDVAEDPGDVRLLGYWDFEDASSPGLDSSPSDHHGTLHGDAKLVRGRLTNGGFEQALAFDGASHLAIDNLGDDLVGLETVTVAAWLRVESHRQMNVFRAQQPLSVNSDGFSVANYATGGGWASLTAVKPPPLGRWYHLAAVFDQGEMRLYVGGALAAERSVSFASLDGTSFDAWSSGARLVGGIADQHLTGAVDDLRIYDAALSAEEIARLAFRHKEPVLLGAWTFDDPADLGRDDSGNGRDAVVIGDVQATQGRLLPGGQATGAIELDGAGYLEIASPGLDLGELEQLTVEAWLTTSRGPSPNVFRADQPVALDSQSFGVWHAATGWSEADATVAPDDGQWRHVAGVFDRGEARFYLDGRRVDTRLLSVSATGAGEETGWTIGAHVEGGVLDQHFEGVIDEVRVSAGAATGFEIAERAGQIIVPPILPVASGGLCEPPPAACGQAEACVAGAVSTCEASNDCFPHINPVCATCLLHVPLPPTFTWLHIAHCVADCGVAPLVEFLDCRNRVRSTLESSAFTCNCQLCTGEPCPAPYNLRVNAQGLRANEVALFQVDCTGDDPTRAPRTVQTTGNHPSSPVTCPPEATTWRVDQGGVWDAHVGGKLRDCSPAIELGPGQLGGTVDVDFDCNCTTDCEPPGRPLVVEACIPPGFPSSIAVATRVTGPNGEDLGIARATLSRAGTFDLGLVAPIGSTYTDAEIGPAPAGFFCFPDQYPGDTVTGGVPDGKPVLVARVTCHPEGGSATDCSSVIDGHRLFGEARPLRGDPPPHPTVQIQVSRPDGTVQTSSGNASREGEFSLHVSAPQGSTWHAELTGEDSCILNPSSGVITEPGEGDLTVLHVGCLPDYPKYHVRDFVLDHDSGLGFPWGWDGWPDCRHVCPEAETPAEADCESRFDPETQTYYEHCEVPAKHCRIECTDINFGPAAQFSVAGSSPGARITADDGLRVDAQADDPDGVKGFSFFIRRAATPNVVEAVGSQYSSGLLTGFPIDTSSLPEGDYTLYLLAVDDHPQTSTPSVAELPFQVRHPATTPPGPCASDQSRPSIDLLTPQDGDLLAAGDVVIEATADDGPGGSGISHVKFWAGPGGSIHTSSEPPHSTTWQATPGVHQVKARAYDQCGNFKSETATVVVQESLCDTSPVPPAVSVTGPSDGAAVEPGLTEIQVAASATAGIDRVELFLDRRPIHSLDEGPFDFGYWFSVEGTYRIEARAWDQCGQSVLSEPAFVTVTISAPPCASDPNPPEVEITTPAGTAMPHGQVTLAADADDELFVAWVAFQVDGSVPPGGVDLTPPYSIEWQGGPGAHTLAVQAEDVCGNVTTLPPMTFNLVNERPTPRPDHVTTESGTAVVIPVLANDSDPNGDPIQLGVIDPIPTPPQHGTATVSGETVIYTPDPGFGSSSGEVDEFWYRIVDPHGGFRATKVTVTVVDLP